MEKLEEKLWGVYNTFVNPEMVETLAEIDIWKRIDNLGGFIFGAIENSEKPWANTSVNVIDLINAQYNLEYLVYSTRRFGVEFSKAPSAKEHVERSESYNAWFRFWHDYFKSMKSMSPEVYNQFVDDYKNGKDISEYMPSGSWKDSLKETSQYAEDEVMEVQKK